MSETQTPPPETKTAHPVQLLETLPSKVFFSSLCFIAPAPLAIVIVDFWLRFQGGVPENQINPLYSIRQGLTGSEFSGQWPLLLAILPPALILCIIYREKKSRIIMLALLLVAAMMEFVGLSQLSPI